MLRHPPQLSRQAPKSAQKLQGKHPQSQQPAMIESDQESLSSTEAGPCGNGLWDGWQSRQGASAPAASFRACATEGCPACRMVSDAAEQLEPGWLAKSQQSDKLKRINITCRERWQLNSAMASLGTASIRLVEGDETVRNLHLYRQITGKPVPLANHQG